MNDLVPDSNRKYPLVPRVGVGIVIINNDNFVLVKRGREPNKGIWTIPGGLVELGELLDEAAKREIYEECGLLIELLEFLDCFEFIDENESGKVKYHYIVLEFLAAYKSGILQADSDAEKAQWFTRNELSTLNTSDKTISLINKAFSRYQVINNQPK